MDFFGLFSPSGHCHRVLFSVLVVHTSTFPASLRSTGVTPLPRYYGRSVVWPGWFFGSLIEHERRFLIPASDPCLPSPNLPAVRSPTTPRCPRILACFPSEAYRTSLLVSRSGPERLGLRLSLAGSPQRLGRIEFVILPTSSSSPVALHPASRRRSYLRLSRPGLTPSEDFHPTDSVRSQAHDRDRSPVAAACIPSSYSSGRVNSSVPKPGWSALQAAPSGRIFSAACCVNGAGKPRRFS